MKTISVIILISLLVISCNEKQEKNELKKVPSKMKENKILSKLGDSGEIYPLAEFYIMKSKSLDTKQELHEEETNDFSIDTSNRNLILSFDVPYNANYSYLGQIDHIYNKEQHVDTIYLDYFTYGSANHEKVEGKELRLVYVIGDAESYKKCVYITRKVGSEKYASKIN